VQSASAINHLPIDGDMWSMGVTVEGRPGPAPDGDWRAVYRIIQPDYLATLGLHLVGGRDFTRRDGPGTPGVAIINESFARAVWPGEDAIGKRFTLLDGGPNPREVVAWSRTSSSASGRRKPTPEMYLAYFQTPPRVRSPSWRARRSHPRASPPCWRARWPPSTPTWPRRRCAAWTTS
jgi:hypothetical protein